MRIRDGQMLCGRYRVAHELGRGGMGLVVAAEDVELGRQVAIKILAPDALTTDSAARAAFTERFVREARTVATLSSEHIVRVLHTDRLPSGEPLMVMERLEGEDLRALLARVGRLPFDEAVYFALQACLGLAAAHRAGVVHRDLKPANLFLDRRSGGVPRLVLLDFGIAKLLAESGLGNDTLTREGQLLGTPQYMSPEQRAGEPIDGRADIWSLGFVLFEALAGRTPYDQANRWAFEYAVMHERPPALSELVSELPAGLSASVDRCLARTPAARFPDVLALARALCPFAPAGSEALLARVESELGPPVGALERPAVPSGAPELDEQGPSVAALAPLPPAVPQATLLQWKSVPEPPPPPPPSADPASTAFATTSEQPSSARPTAAAAASHAVETGPGDETLVRAARRRTRLGLWAMVVVAMSLAAVAVGLTASPQSARPAVDSPVPARPSPPAETSRAAHAGAGAPSLTLEAPADAPLQIRVSLVDSDGRCPARLRREGGQLRLREPALQAALIDCRADLELPSDTPAAPLDVRLDSACFELADGKPALRAVAGGARLVVARKAACRACRPCRCRDPLTGALCHKCEVACGPCPESNRCLD